MLTQQDLDNAVNSEMELLNTALQDAATRLHMQFALTLESARAMLLSHFKEFSFEHGADGRAHIWQVRLLIWDERDEVIADSDPERTLGDAGATRLISLKNVGTWAQDLICMCHQAPIAGIDDAVVARKIRSLRVQLSNRKDGTGSMLFDYEVAEVPTAVQSLVKPRSGKFRARCYVVRGVEEQPKSPMQFGSLKGLR